MIKTAWRKTPTYKLPVTVGVADPAERLSLVARSEQRKANWHSE
jgi:hypothetical protein